ncbi:hypothetical protein [Chitinophaga sp. LS1]|uniref:toxin-antitoxin system YwqK family antitoxin n=1 Tax=Chitinophaga sp. LS1 TaxID=3051176 RepID=UPI002AABBFFF|nr:hypothetical protein [Chitinophaga sp. LS1]WPV68096.1 hypothetical protein QQL36_05080 [Chitinophaga sp. LS1]
MKKVYGKLFPEQKPDSVNCPSCSQLQDSGHIESNNPVGTFNRILNDQKKGMRIIIKKILNKMAALARICSLVPLVYGCNNQGAENSYKSFLNDGNGGFIEVVLNENGKISESFQLRSDSVKNGSYKKFFSDGTLESVGQFKNGMMDSFWTNYYHGGKVKEQQYWVSGKQFCEQKSYRPDGRLKEFEFKALDLGTVSLIQYDEQNQIINWEGFPIYCVFNSNKIKRGEEYVLGVFFGAPLAFDIEVRIEAKRINDNKVIYLKKYDANSVEILNFGRRIVIKETMQKNGDYLWDIHFHYKGDKIGKDKTVNLRVKVE